MKCWLFICFCLYWIYCLGLFYSVLWSYNNRPRDINWCTCIVFARYLSRNISKTSHTRCLWCYFYAIFPWFKNNCDFSTVTWKDSLFIVLYVKKIYTLWLETRWVILSSINKIKIGVKILISITTRPTIFAK